MALLRGDGIRSAAHRRNRPASFVLRNFDADTWRSPAEGAGWLQGIELPTTGRIRLPVPEPNRAYLRSIRRGERPLVAVLDAVTGAEARLTKLRESTTIPDQPTALGR